VLGGSCPENPKKAVLQAYERAEAGGLRPPVTLAGFVRLNAKWFMSLTEGEDSPEHWDILVWWAGAVFTWLKEAIDPSVLSCVLSCGKREPKIYFVFSPEFSEGGCAPLSAARRRKVILELEDRLIHFMLASGLPAEACTQEFTYDTLQEYLSWSGFVRGGGKPRTTEPDLRRALTWKDSLTWIKGGDAWRRRLCDLSFQALHDGSLDLIKMAAASQQVANMSRLHSETQERMLSSLHDWGQRLGKQAEALKGPDLRLVLTRLYTAQRAPEAPSGGGFQDYVLPNERRIAVKGEDWAERGTEFGGDGALSLAAHLSGGGADGALRGLRELRAAFPRQSAEAAFLYHISRSPEGLAEKLLGCPFSLPETSEELWPDALSDLAGHLRAPRNVLEALHAAGLLLADSQGNLLMVCDRVSGAFGASFHARRGFAVTWGPGPRALPFYVPGTRGKIFICEDPLTAVKIKGREPAAHTLAFCRGMPLERLDPYLDGKEIVLHFKTCGRVSGPLADHLLSSGRRFLTEFGYVRDFEALKKELEKGAGKEGFGL
jgi:hypothetical protein